MVLNCGRNELLRSFLAVIIWIIPETALPQHNPVDLHCHATLSAQAAIYTDKPLTTPFVGDAHGEEPVDVVRAWNGAYGFYWKDRLHLVWAAQLDMPGDCPLVYDKGVEPHVMADFAGVHVGDKLEEALDRLLHAGYSYAGSSTSHELHTMDFYIGSGSGSNPVRLDMVQVGGMDDPPLTLERTDMQGTRYQVELYTVAEPVAETKAFWHISRVTKIIGMVQHQDMGLDKFTELQRQRYPEAKRIADEIEPASDSLWAPDPAFPYPDVGVLVTSQYMKVVIRDTAFAVSQKFAAIDAALQAARSRPAVQPNF